MQNLTRLETTILNGLESLAGRHVLGPDLAASVGCNPRTVRGAVRRLRYQAGRWDILSRAGDNVQTDGYWISNDPAEIEQNRIYHHKQGLDHLSRASHMTTRRSQPIAESTGQVVMFA